MRVGDTVRRTTHNTGGLRVGDTYVVSAFEPRLNGVSVEGHAEMFAAEFFEVVREAPEPVDVVDLGAHNEEETARPEEQLPVAGPEEMTHYVVFYVRDNGERRSLGYGMQEEANQLCTRIVQNGGRVIKKSKVTVRV